MTGIRKEDIVDAEIIDAEELISDGTFLFRSGVLVTSTTTGTNQIVVSGGLLYLPDTRVEAGDRITISGSAAAGTYTISSITNDTTLIVVEMIVTSTGGTADFKHPSGSSRVGFDPTGLTNTSATTVQAAIKDIDTAVSGGGLTANQHRMLRQLIHFIDGGPAEGFASLAYSETLPSGDPFPTSETWWESSAKLKRIVDEVVTYNVNKTVATDQWRVYDTDGVAILATVTDTISYSGIFETSRTRAIA